jgi:hypothetical protein
MAKTVAYLSPTTPKDILQLNLWWREEYQGLHFGIIMSRAYILNKNGLRYFRDIWDPGRYDFLTWEDAKEKFSLEEVHRDFWIKLTEYYGPFRERMLNQQNALLTSQEWVGLYRNTEDALPEWVVCAGYLKEFSPGPVQFSAEFMGTFPKSTVGSQYFTLTEIKPNTKNAPPPTAFSGWMIRVRIDRLTRGSSKTQFNLFFGKLDQLFFDPARWWWPEVTPFFAYSAKEGRKWITKQIGLKKSISHKWRNEIPPSTSPRWNTIWHKAKAQKEAAFLWSVIHKAVAVNEWRGKISVEIDQSCPHCGPQSVESVEHRFYSCPLAQQVWRYAANIVWQLFAKKRHLGPRKSFSMLQCLFDQPLCKTLKRFNRIWFFLRSGLPWIIWRQRNDLIFNKLQWPIEKTRQIIWDALQDYGRIEWKRTLRDLEKAPDVAYHDILNNFDLIWGVKGLIVTRSNLVVTWKDRPQMSIIS